MLFVERSGYTYGNLDGGYSKRDDLTARLRYCPAEPNDPEMDFLNGSRSIEKESMLTQGDGV